METTRNIWSTTVRDLTVRDETEDMLCYLEEHPEDFDIRPEAVDLLMLYIDMDSRELYGQIPYACRLIQSCCYNNRNHMLKALTWWIERWEEVEDIICEDEAMYHEG